MKYKIGIGLLIALVAGYVIGQLIPVEQMRPEIEPKSLESKDYYSLIVQIVAATATFLAVVIALFREEIRRWWEFVQIDYSIPTDKFIEVLNENIGDPSQGASQPLEAEKYLCTLEITNNGTISSHASEIILESVVLESKEFTNPQIIETNGLPLTWGNTNENRITIPPKGRKKVVILELIAPEKESTPESEESISSPELNFSGVDDEKKFTNGVWRATYLVYSSNCRPRRFEVHVTWNGKWQGRKTEMRNCLKVDLKSK